MVKKVLKIVLIVIVAVLFVIGVIFGIKFLKEKKTGVQSATPIQSSTMQWKQMEVLEELIYQPNYNVPAKSEILTRGFFNHEYVNIQVPNRETVNLFGSSVYATDGSFSIILTNNQGNLDVASTIVNSMNLSENVICTKNGEDTTHIVCKVFDDFTVTAYVYSNSADWSMIRDMVQNLEPASDILISDELNNLTKDDLLTMGTGQELVGSINETMVPQDTYTEDGVFRSIMYPVTYQQAIDSAIAYMNAITQDSELDYYSDENITYISCGQYSVGVIDSDNDNYSYLLFGIGSKARSTVAGLVI